MAESARPEEHILSLLPRNQFHSCLLTTFSFEFNYFLHNVRSQLSRAEIINVNVFVDDAMLQHYLGTMTGYAHTGTGKYALTGIPSRGGVFHPKLGLFFGDKEQGFMILGSGNLTSCGHGKNQELWGAFHIDGPGDPKAPLFRAAWEYLRGFRESITGISRQKIDWIEQHAGWISRIPDVVEWIPLDKNVDAKLLTNSGEEGIWQRFVASVADEAIEEVTIISPFFDAAGETLTDLCDVAGDATVHLVVQPWSCKFPKMETYRVPANLVFHDWDSIHPDNKERYVHAKLLHIKTQESEYCLLGSANLTSAAMGTGRRGAKNEEASILLRAKNNVLGRALDVANRGTVLSTAEIMAQAQSIEGGFSKTPGELRLNSVDSYGSTLHVYMARVENASSLELRLFDGWEDQVDAVSMGQAEYVKQYSCYRTLFEPDGQVLFAQLFDTSTNTAASNKVVVHDAKALLNTNPDPANKKLEKAIAQIESGQSDLISLLRYINPDDIVESKRKHSGGGRTEEEDKETHHDGSGDVLDYDQFTKQSEEETIDRLGLYSNSGHTIDRILELVRLLLQKAADQVVDAHVEEEDEKDNVDDTEGREDVEVDPVEPPLPPQKPSAFTSNQRKLKRFFDKYIKTQGALLKKKVPLSKLDHSLFAVVLHLLLDFFRKPVLITEKSTEKVERRYLLDSRGDFFDKADYCRYVAEIIGQHSLRLALPQQEAANPYEKGILENVKRSAYWNAVCAIALAELAVGQEELAATWIWELFMNLRRNCGVGDCGTRNGAIEHLSSLANILHTEDRDRHLKLIMAFWDKHENEYSGIDFDSRGKGGVRQVGQRVYSDTFGFCHICSCELSDKGHKIELARPGYPPASKEYDFPKGNKCISEMMKLVPMA